ncbi:hypothetical protein BASA60_002758 [Batrachochytrium salamandrivorans]|nr:hypothetical protein BASA60_002758 [Batrachochytrium salamandrivorans]
MELTPRSTPAAPQNTVLDSPITSPKDNNATSSSASTPKQQTHGRIRKTTDNRLPDQLRPTAPPPPTITQTLAFNLPHHNNDLPSATIVRNTKRLGHLREPALTSSKSRHCTWFRFIHIRHVPDAEELPRIQLLVGLNMVVHLATMILASTQLHARKSVDSRICLCNDITGATTNTVA